MIGATDGSDPKRRRGRVVRLVIFCTLWSIADISAVAVTGERDLLAVGVVPIVLTGWLFSGRAVVFTAGFLYVANAIYMTYWFSGGHAPEEFRRGLVAYAFFLAIGFFVAWVTGMSRRIRALNQELVEKNKELAALSLHDHLTGLYNRRFVNDVVFDLAVNFLGRLRTPEVERREANVGKTVIAVLMVDIDHFKAINDTHGHAAGDRVLVEIAARLRKAVRFDDVVVRWGGEEFLMICSGARRDSLDLIANKVLREVRLNPYPISNQRSLDVTVSLGCTHYPIFEGWAEAFSFEEVIGIADAALYLSKEGGRDRVTVVRPKQGLTEAPPSRQGIAYRDLIQDTSLFVLETTARKA